MSAARRGRSRASARGMTAVELAVTFAVVGSVLAVAVPAFLRNLRASKLVEPVDGLNAIAEGANAYAKAHDVPHAYPPSVALTPPLVPRGTREADPPGVWDQPTWKALGFRGAEEGVPHAFAFAFDATNGPTHSTFTAVAHGDLDGDGVLSRFEVHGHDDTRDVQALAAKDAGKPGGREDSAKPAGKDDPSRLPEQGPVIDPGMVVEAELE